MEPIVLGVLIGIALSTVVDAVCLAVMVRNPRLRGALDRLLSR